MADWDINFGWVSSAQSLKSSVREVKGATAGFARMIVNEAAIAAADDAYETARNRVIGSVRAVVMSEVSRMAVLISNSIALPDKYTGPYGDMSLKEGMSETARRFGFSATFKRQRTSIVWSKRGRGYLRWKQRNGHPAKWWEMTGDLAKELRDEQQYVDAFGPVVVRFTRGARRRNENRSAQQDRAGAGISRAVDPLTQQSRISGLNVIQTGGKGRYSVEYQIGTLEVITFGRITPQMIPALAHPKMDPARAAPTDNSEGLAGLFPDGDTKMKLLGRQEHRRYAIEPFVSFFLTRAIPNAVWRRTEQLLERGASG